MPRRCFKSAPALKALSPAPVTIAQRSERSARAASMRAASAPSSAVSKALSASGRSIVQVTIAASRVW
jgi:hypothetical protein